MIIGTTGELCSGKGVFADYLVQRGFKYFSLSDFLREELARQGKEITRDNLVDLGNRLRKEHDHGVLAKKAVERIAPNFNYVIDSIRNPAEVNELKKLRNFFLAHITAPLKTRYDRAVARKRESEHIGSLDEFKKSEERELKSKDPHKQQLIKTAKMADIVINNKYSTLKEFYDIIEKVVEDLTKRENKNRPSWDEYFIGIMMAVGQRGTCDRGKSGSVIVKNRQILATGYVGAPKGAPHCDDVGHQMKTMIEDDGSQSKHCVRTTHAEQNAICQAAKNGVAIDGATLYCKMEPCSTCAKMIINSGIKRVVAYKRYHKAAETRDLFKKCGVQLFIVNDELETYKDMK